MIEMTNRTISQSIGLIVIIINAGKLGPVNVVEGRGHYNAHDIDTNRRLKGRWVYKPLLRTRRLIPYKTLDRDSGANAWQALSRNIYISAQHCQLRFRAGNSRRNQHISYTTIE